MEFKYADWNPVTQTVPAYFVDRHSGLVSAGTVFVDKGGPCDPDGHFEYVSDGKNERLRGWGHTWCESFNDGSVLIPLRASICDKLED